MTGLHLAIDTIVRGLDTMNERESSGAELC